MRQTAIGHGLTDLAPRMDARGHGDRGVEMLAHPGVEFLQFRVLECFECRDELSANVLSRVLRKLEFFCVFVEERWLDLPIETPQP